MNFRQSAVTALTRDNITEQADQPPIGIQPALLGTGELTLSLDATGLQGLNSHMPQYPDAASYVHGSYFTERYCHLYRDEALSRHYFNPVERTHGDNPTQYANLPCGYLDYTVTIDGTTYTAQDIAEQSTDWERNMTPREGQLDTWFVLAGVRIAWSCVMPNNSVEAVFGLTWSSDDGAEHEVTFEVFNMLRVRGAGPIATGGLSDTLNDTTVVRVWEASSETSSAELLEPITMNWGFGPFKWTEGSQVASFAEGDRLGLRITTQGLSADGGFVLVSGSDRDGTAEVSWVQQRLDAAAELFADDALEVAAQSWDSFFADAAELHIGDPEKEFITAQAQYVLKAGGGWHSGLPLGTLWTQKFSSATFWDSFFAGDGMARAGHIDLLRQFCDWLIASKQAEGRNHYWTTYYNGMPANNTEQDVAIQSSLAYAGICIRLFDIGRDEDDLRRCIVPYLHQLSGFLIEESIIGDAQNGWKLKGTIAHDIGIKHEVAEEMNTYLVWIVMTLAKLVEYADRIGQNDELVERCREIDQYYRANPLEVTRHGEWFSWLLYLAPALPHVDIKDFGEKLLNKPKKKVAGEREVAGEEGRGSGLGGNISGMPWANASTAATMLRARHPNEALEMFNGALHFISGQGHLVEGPYESHIGGNSPYVPSEGAWLSAIHDFLVTGDPWGDRVEVCAQLPVLWKHQHLRFERIRSSNGAVVSATYTPSALDATIVCPEPRTVVFGVPGRISGEPLSVTLNGETVEADEMVEEGVGRLTLQLPTGEHTVTIARDLATSFDVLLMEPFDHGREVKAMLEETGLSVRWLRDLDGLDAALQTVRAVFVDPSYNCYSEGTFLKLKAAVESGKHLIALFHAGARELDARMAELLGVNADFHEDWIFDSQPVGWTPTDRGRAVLGEAARDMTVPQTQRFTLNAAEDVEALMLDAESGQPVLTCRSVGQGTAWWCATGDRMMDWTHKEQQKLYVREIYIHGHNRDNEAPRTWLHDAAAREILKAIVSAAAAPQLVS